MNSMDMFESGTVLASMIVSLIQIILVGNLIASSLQNDNNNRFETLKRSPLEFGLVSFTNVRPHLKIFGKTHQPLLNNEIFKSKSQTTTDTEHVLVHAHTKHEWIPGHVHNHAFIPAHSHNVFIPTTSVILTKSVHSIILPYRNHYGGFGIGVNSGGPGAGHGYHVVF